MTDARGLLAAFPPHGYDEWRAEVERLLKGAPFAQRMITRLPEGFDVAPLYRADDIADVPWLAAMPGTAPFVRGPRAAGYHAAPWWISQELRSVSCEDFNNALRDGLQRGQTAAVLILDQAGMAGLDPDQSEADLVGQGGVSLCSLQELDTALDGVDLAAVPVQIESGAAALPVAAMLVALARRRRVDLKRLRGCLGADPFAGLARRGRINGSLDLLLDELAMLSRWTAVHAPGLRTLPVHETPWHDGGADLALGLALTLCGAVETLRAMDARGIAPGEAAPRFQFNVAVGTDFFAEIAKLRALRLLWSRILTASGVAPGDATVFIHARTALRDQTDIDPHVNLLRGTTKAMSAVLGGVDSLHVSPFDAVGGSDAVSRRIARNVQLILSHECHLDQVADPAGGSWYVESLTRDLAEAAWRRFQECEADGGLKAALESGRAQASVAAAAQRRADELATRRAVRVGVNAYPPADWSPRPPRDAEGLRRRRGEVLSRQRSSATQEAHLLVLGRLEKLMDCPGDELFEPMVGAVDAGATLGEVIGVTRASSEPGLVVEPIPLRREALPFELLRGRVAVRAQTDPAAVTVHLACLGDFARYMPRLDFARGFFQVGGFRIAGADTWHAEASAAAAAARATGARTVVLVGLDETYADLAAATARALKSGPHAPAVVVAGSPGDQEDAWRAAGVDHFIALRSHVLDVLGGLLDAGEDRP
ncbi:acyl-CoA mutase large subunit family protein [bacterium]|nr:acyl-CoA mutase large subunit family protein [bacterium]